MFKNRKVLVTGGTGHIGRPMCTGPSIISSPPTLWSSPLQKDPADVVLESDIFRIWKRRVESHGNIVRDIQVVGVVSRDSKGFYGALLDCELLTPEGARMRRCMLMMGDSVIIVPVLHCIEDGQTYTLMVRQRRITDGDHSLEFTAGGMDLRQEDPKAAACQEVQEELDLTVSPEELIPLSCEPVEVVPSCLDGRMNYFYFERTVPQSFLQSMDGRHTGCRHEDEDICVKVRKMSEVADALTPSALIGLKLLEKKLGRAF